MLKIDVISAVVIVLILGSFLFAEYMNTIRMRAWLDQKIVTKKWFKYHCFTKLPIKKNSIKL